MITYGRERALVLQGPGDGGNRRVSVTQVGAGGCAFRGGSGSLLRGMADWSKRPGSTAPTFPGGGLDPWGFQPYILPRPGPLFSQRHFPNSRHYYFIQVTPVLLRRAGKKPGGDSRGLNGPEGRRGRRRHPVKSFAKPYGQFLIPFPAHNPSNLLAFPRHGLRRVIPCTHRWTFRSTRPSKTRKPRLVLELSIYPFATWIPIFQEREAAKAEPAPSPASPQLHPLDLGSCQDCLARPSALRPRPRFPSSNH